MSYTMNRILFIMLIAVNCYGQFTAKNLTPTATFLLWGQSNATNLYDAQYYNSGATERFADTLSINLTAIEGKNVEYVRYLADGRALAQNANPDFNVKSHELYNDCISRLSSDPNNSTDKLLGQKKAQNKACKMFAAIWIQGETDASDAGQAAAYYGNINVLIDKLRADLMEPELAFIIVRLHPGINRGQVGTVRTAMNDVGERTGVYIVDIDDFVSSDFASPGIATNVHYSVAGLKKIQERIQTIITTNNLIP